MTELWRKGGPQQSWFLAFAFAPDGTVFAGGDDCIGVYRSSDGEPPWELVLPDFCAWSLAINPHDASHLVAGDTYGRGIMRTLDGGQTWELVVTGLPRWDGGRYATAWSLGFDPEEDVVYLAAGAVNAHGNPSAGAGVWRSDDRGESWSLLGLDGKDVRAICCLGDGVILAGCGGQHHGVDLGLYRSADGGKTWDLVLADASVANIIRDASDGNRAHAAVAGQGVFFSGDRGATWTIGAGQKNGSATWGVGQDPSASSLLYSVVVAGDSTCYRSQDAGATWVPTPLAGYAGIGLGVSLKGDVYVGTYGFGFWKSSDGGESWRSVEESVSHSYVYGPLALDRLNSDRLIAPVHSGLGIDEGVHLSPDGGAKWKPAAFPVEKAGNVYAICIDPHVAGRVFAANFMPGVTEGLFVSTDGGESWRTVDTFGQRPCVSVCVDPALPAQIWVGAHDGLWISRDDGQSWEERKDLSGQVVKSITFHPKDPETVLVATGGKNWGGNDPGGFWETNDRGLTFRKLPVAEGRGCYNAVFLEDRIFFAHEGGLSSTSDGDSVELLLDRPTDKGAWVSVDPSSGFIYYAGNNYLAIEPGCILKSEDRGATWQDLWEPGMTREIWAMSIDPGRRLYASSFGSGIWALELSGS